MANQTGSSEEMGPCYDLFPKTRGRRSRSHLPSFLEVFIGSRDQWSGVLHDALTTWSLSGVVQQDLDDGHVMKDTHWEVAFKVASTTGLTRLKR
jgi:hypothetical protein